MHVPLIYVPPGVGSSDMFSPDCADPVEAEDGLFYTIFTRISCNQRLSPLYDPL